MKLVRALLKAAFPDSAWEVDLHGLRVPEALAVVEEAIAAVKKAGGGKVRIICGKGKGSKGGVGVLREAVGGWLAARGHGEFVRKVEKDGLDGSILLEVKSDGERTETAVADGAGHSSSSPSSSSS